MGTENRVEGNPDIYAQKMKTFMSLQSESVHRAIIKGKVEDVDTMIHTLVGVFSDGTLASTGKRDEISSLLSIQLPPRIKSIQRDEELYNASSIVHSVLYGDLPEVVVAIGRNMQNGKEVVLFRFLVGRSAEEEFDKFKARLRETLEKKSN